jgi:VRR-NUC domain
MKTSVINSEHHEQACLMEWATLAASTLPQLHNLFAVPNGGHRHITVAMRMKAEGVKPGVPDLFLAWPSNGSPGLFIEMKNRVGGIVSKAQKEWRDRLTMCGYCVQVCKGWEEAKDAIVSYLKGEI